MLITKAAQLVTCASGSVPKRGHAMRDVAIVEDGAIAIKDSKIVAIGPSADIQAQYDARETLNARGKAVCPGFVDPHTHVVYGGNRIDEFELRIQGKSYMDIMAAGGGIVSTMRATRSLSVDELAQQAADRIRRMVQLGTTTVEVKSGYGLDADSELKLMRAIEQLSKIQPATIVPTFMGAHAIPPEYKNFPDDYTQHVIDSMIPHVAAWYKKSTFKKQGIPLFIDVFCEDNAFTVEQSRRILEAGKAHGMDIKAHVDEFNSLGAVAMALELGATSIDHLDVSTAHDIAKLAQSDCVGIVIPAVNFNLGSTHFANARAMIEAGCAIALTTDINPGSAPCPSMQFVMAVACRYQRLLPAEALIASTINAAHAVGLGDRIGSLEVGKQADILILDTPDYRYLAYDFGGNHVQTVMKAGTVIVQNS